MAPTNSRPPLTSRIRASFEGNNRRKSDASNNKPINSFAIHDPEALQNAVEKAISGDAFQGAIAKHLAKLIEPSITSALDTIQPVVETVYKHQVLLRKMNRSVENILQRLDTGTEGEVHGQELDTEGQELEREVPISRDSEGYFSNPSPRSDSTPTPRNARHVTHEAPDTDITKKLSDISNLVDANHGKVEEGFTSVHAALLPTTEGIELLKSSTEQSHTNTAVVQAQLDQLTSDVGVIMDAIRSDLGVTMREIYAKINNQDTSLLSSHGRKLDAISDHLEDLKGESGSELLQEISENIGALRETIEAGIVSNNDNFNTLGSHFSNVLSSMETHSGALMDLQQADNGAEILAAVQRSNDSHASHATILSEIKDRGIGSGSKAAPTPENSAETTAALQTLSSDLAALKENIEAGLTSNGDGLTGLGTKIEGALAAIESHRAADSGAEILAAVQKSNDSHASHATALEKIRALNSEQAATGTNDISELEAKVGDIILTLQSYSTVLDEIKTKAPPVSEVAPTGNMETDVKTIIEILDAHSNMLTEIREADVSDEILTALHECNEYQSRHLAALEDIKETDVSDEILTALHTCNESHENHTVALAAIHDAVKTSNDAHTAHAAALDEIKATRSLESSAPAETGNLEALETHITTIVASLEGHSSTLSEIKDATAASNDSHAAHSAALAEIKDIATRSNNFHTSHSTALAELKAGQSSDVSKESTSDTHHDSLATIEAQIDTIIATLETQNTTLADIKEAAANPNILTAIEQSHELLTSHSSLLHSIKDENSYEDILANISYLKSIIEESKTDILNHGTLVKDLHEETKISHEGLAAAITALGAGLDAGALASKHDSGLDDNALLEEVKAVRIIVEKSSTSIETTRESITSMTSQIDINNTTMTTSICTLGDELKAEIDASSTEMTNSILGLSEDVKGVDLEHLKIAVESVVKGVTVLVGGVDILNNNVDTTAAHVTELVDGVHLNEKGLGQLKDHSMSSHTAPSLVQTESIPEPITAKEAEPEPEIPIEESEPTQDLITESEDPESAPEPAAEPEIPIEGSELTQDPITAAEPEIPIEGSELTQDPITAAEPEIPIEESEPTQDLITEPEDPESAPEPAAEPEIPIEESEPTQDLVTEPEDPESAPEPAAEPEIPIEGSEPTQDPITESEVPESVLEATCESENPVEESEPTQDPITESEVPESVLEATCESENPVEESEPTQDPITESEVPEEVPEPEQVVSTEVAESTSIEPDKHAEESMPVNEKQEQPALVPLKEEESDLLAEQDVEPNICVEGLEYEHEPEASKEVAETHFFEPEEHVQEEPIQEEPVQEEESVKEEQQQEHRSVPSSSTEDKPSEGSIEPESKQETAREGKEAEPEEPAGNPQPLEQEQEHSLPSPEAVKPEPALEPGPESELLIEEPIPEPETPKEAENAAPDEPENLVGESGTELEASKGVENRPASDKPEESVSEETPVMEEQAQESARLPPKEAETLEAPEQEIPQEVTEAEPENNLKEEKLVIQEHDQEPVPPSPKEIAPLQAPIEPSEEQEQESILPPENVDPVQPPTEPSEEQEQESILPPPENVDPVQPPTEPLEEQEQESILPPSEIVDPVQPPTEPKSATIEETEPLDKGKAASLEETPTSLSLEPEEEEPPSSESTSTITSPLSPTFSTEASSSGKKGKKGKKEKKEKKEKKSKKEKFTFEPEEGDVKE